MMKKPSEGKAPITGLSAKERVAARQRTKAGRKVVAKRIKDAVEHRGRVVLGDAAARYLPEDPALRRLVKITLRDVDQDDVNEWLGRLDRAEQPRGDLDFHGAWDQWEKLRALNQRIEGAWAGVEQALGNQHEGPDPAFDIAVDIVRNLVDDWVELMGIEHPLGRILGVGPARGQTIVG